MTTRYYRYLPHGQPIPDGWKLAHDFQDNRHGAFAVLIMANHPRRSIIKNWPKFLKDFRAKHKLTQKELADRLQVSCRLVENWEGAINMPPPYLRKALDELIRCEK